MLIICPDCSTSYRIDPDALGAGRMMRCARCRAEWYAGATEAPPAPAPVRGLDDVEAIDAFDAVFDPPKVDVPAPARRGLFRGFARRPRISASPKPSRFAALRGLKTRPAVVFAVAGTAALAYAITARADIVRSAPSLASLYAAVGLPVNVVGFTIGDLASVEEVEEGVPILLVTGAVSNVAGAPADPPRLLLTVRSGDDRELYSWTTLVGRAKLAPGESATFRARLASPPAEGRAVAVRFLTRHHLQAGAR